MDLSSQEKKDMVKYHQMPEEDGLSSVHFKDNCLDHEDRSITMDDELDRSRQSMSASALHSYK
jgi:hypothetical protein